MLITYISPTTGRKRSIIVYPNSPLARMFSNLVLVTFRGAR